MDPKKSEFAVKETKYLGFIILVTEGIKVDQEKVKAINDWQAPTSTKGVRSFVEFSNFYRDFIPNFSLIADPLLKLSRNQTPFLWEDHHQKTFDKLKKLFSTAPILALWEDNKETVLEADCSGYVLGDCLSQKDTKGALRPIAYLHKKLSPTEASYDVHDKELLAIVRCMKEWRGMLIGLDKPFIVLSDHQNSKPFMTTRRLNERKVRWSQLLSQFNFKLQYRAGWLAGRQVGRTLCQDVNRICHKALMMNV